MRAHKPPRPADHERGPLTRLDSAWYAPMGHTEMIRTAAALVALSLVACQPAPPATAGPSQPTPTAPPGEGEGAAVAAALDPLPQEKRLAGLFQLTFGGENAEAYFSFDERELIFQSTRDDLGCDQIFVMGADGASPTMVSTGQGRTTCAYFLPGDRRILFSSTHAAHDACPPPPDRTHGYVWKLYDEYEIYTANRDGSDLQALVTSPGYDAEATVSPTGDRIVFTSTRDGDPEIYVINVDGSGLKRLTKTPGYDGGPFFSRDGKRIVYRANHPEGKDEIAKYQAIIREGLVRPTRLEIFVMDADGSNQVQITKNGAANFAPFFHPSGDKIIFASNVRDERGRNFDLFLIGVDGNGLEQVTFNDTFDGFPMFTADGKKLVFASNRNGAKPGDTNIFMADWVDSIE